MATTWSTPAIFQAKAVCTTGSESAPSAATDGMDLTTVGGVYGVVVHVAAHDGSTNLTAASTLKGYLYDPQRGAWDRCPDIDVTIEGGSISQGSPGYEVVPVGRLAWVPSGLGTAVDVYITGTGRP